MTDFLQRGSGLDAFTKLVLRLFKRLKRRAMTLLELRAVLLLHLCDVLERLFLLHREHKRRFLALYLVRVHDFFTELLINFCAITT